VNMRGVTAIDIAIIVILLVFFSSLTACTSDYGYQESVKKVTQELSQNKTKSPDLVGKSYEPALVVIRDSLVFDPERVTIARDQAVVWQVQGSVEESLRLTEQNGLFVSDSLRANDAFTFTFSQEGEYKIEIVDKGRAMQVEVI